MVVAIAYMKGCILADPDDKTEIDAAPVGDGVLPGSEEVSEERLYAFRVRTAFASFAPVVIGNVINAAIIVAVMYGHVAHSVVFTWIGALIATVVLRAVLSVRFRARSDSDADIGRWARLYGAGTVATGILWGVAGWIFVLPDLPHTQLVTVIIIAGMVAGALSTLRTLPHLYAAFAVSAVAPLIVRFALFQDLESVLLAGAFALFVLLMSLQAFALSRQLTLSEARRIANLTLTESLHAAKISAEAANAAKSAFLATMSHEIRTPMTGVMGFADGLLADDLPPASKQKVARIKDSTQSLLQIINEVLDISKLEAGKLEIEYLDFDLPSLMRNTVSMFQDDTRDGLKVSLNLAGDLPRAIHGDPTRLRQILINLLGNAVKFTKSGSIIVTVEPRVDEYGDILYFAVADTGIGIAEDTLPKLFTDFTQADTSITREFEGTGLGLAICRRLVELMGGDIGAESELGEGSTFWFILPCVLATSEVPEEDGAGEPERVMAETVESLNLLVAEDNEINQRIIAEVLDTFGHQHDIVDDGDAAVSAHEQGDYDLIVMDVRMPKVSGPDATRMIRRMEGPKSEIPIIALTADAMVEHRKGYFEAGMDGVATKPIDRNELAMAINDAIGREVHRFEAVAPPGDGQDTEEESSPEAEAAVNDFLAELDVLDDGDAKS